MFLIFKFLKNLPTTKDKKMQENNMKSTRKNIHYSTYSNQILKKQPWIEKIYYFWAGQPWP